MAIEQKRVPQDLDDRRLLDIGWRFAGLQLFEYPLNDSFRGYWTKEQALKLTEENGLDLYCPLCGSCGEEGCCRPEKCKCFYAEHYNKTYRELLDEHEAFYQLVRGLAVAPLDFAPVSREVQLNAQQLLEEFGYDTD